MSNLGLPRSLWAATAESAPQTEKLRSSEKADVAIVGAGFTGLRAALELARGGATVRVLEQAEIGYGASGRTGGQVIPGLRPDPDELEQITGRKQADALFEVASRSADELFNLVSHHNIRCDACQKGWIQVAHNTASRSLIESRYRQWQRRGAAVELLEKSDITRLTGAETYTLGWMHARGGSVQPLSYARGLARVALQSGAHIYTQSPAIKIVRDGSQWTIHTPEGTVQAEQVIICTNGYTDKMWPGLAQTVVPVFSMQVATKPLSDKLRNSILQHKHTIADTRRLILYFRLDRDHRLVFGGIGKQHESSNPNDYTHLCRLAIRVFPQLLEPEWDFFWGGYFAVTRDRLPHICQLAPGVTSCIGYNGRGVAMSTVMGRVLAEHVLERLESIWPISKIDHFPLHRFYSLGVKTRLIWGNLLDRLESK